MKKFAVVCNLIILALFLQFLVEKQSQTYFKSIITQIEPILKVISVSPKVRHVAELSQDSFFFISNSGLAFKLPSPLTFSSPVQEGLLIYKVQKGDTLSEIAERFHLSINTIRWASPNLKSSYLYVGQSLVILPVDGVLHQVKSGETLESIASLYGVSSAKIMQYNPYLEKVFQPPFGKLIIPGGKPLTQKKEYLRDLGNYFSTPAAGWNLGMLRDYNAVNIVNCCGTPVYASAEGLVIEAKTGWNLGYGNYVKIKHPNGTYTVYAHLGEILVEKDTYVKKGQKIGLMGNSGQSSTECHLHFEVHGAKNPFAKY